MLYLPISYTAMKAPIISVQLIGFDQPLLTLCHCLSDLPDSQLVWRLGTVWEAGNSRLIVAFRHRWRLCTRQLNEGLTPYTCTRHEAPSTADESPVCQSTRDRHVSLFRTAGGKLEEFDVGSQTHWYTYTVLEGYPGGGRRALAEANRGLESE